MEFIFKKWPDITSISIPGDRKKFNNRIKEDGILDVWISNEGKTALDIYVGRDSNHFRFNYTSPLYKFKAVSEHNWFTGESRVQNYFKILKSQNMEDLKKHIRYLVKEHFIKKDLEVNILHLYVSPRVHNEELKNAWKENKNNQIASQWNQTDSQRNSALSV